MTSNFNWVVEVSPTLISALTATQARFRVSFGGSAQCYQHMKKRSLCLALLPTKMSDILSL